MALLGKVKKAYKHAAWIMSQAGMPVVDRGCPDVQVVQREYGGSYSPYYHLIKVGPGIDYSTLVHECCHSLQPEWTPPKGYKSNPDAYLDCSQERDAFFCELVAKVGLKDVRTGDNLRFRYYDKPSRSLKLRINKARKES